jgi:hypothetical protein
MSTRRQQPGDGLAQLVRLGQGLQRVQIGRQVHDLQPAAIVAEQGDSLRSCRAEIQHHAPPQRGLFN